MWMETVLSGCLLLSEARRPAIPCLLMTKIHLGMAWLELEWKWEWEWEWG